MLIPTQCRNSVAPIRVFLTPSQSKQMELSGNFENVSCIELFAAYLLGEDKENINTSLLHYTMTLKSDFDFVDLK
jgi:hypothetical protein